MNQYHFFFKSIFYFELFVLLLYLSSLSVVLLEIVKCLQAPCPIYICAPLPPEPPAFNESAILSVAPPAVIPTITTSPLPNISGVEVLIPIEPLISQTTRTISAQTIVTTETLNSGSISLINSLPTGVVSGSAQTISNLPTGVVSGSAQTILNLPTGTVSGSSQVVDILSSLNTYTGSNDTKWTSLSNITSSLISVTGSYATTGSNTFFGTQVFSGSVFIATDLIVQGSSSIQYISASSVSIGTNIVQLNTATPSVRFAGMSVQDSGSSAGVTGSMLWDSLCNRWIYSNPSTIGYSGGMLLSGPRASTKKIEPVPT